jgi:hypothetical protein
MASSGSSGQVTCPTCQNEVPNAPSCRICGDPLSESAPAPPSGAAEWQPFGRPVEAPPGTQSWLRDLEQQVQTQRQFPPPMTPPSPSAPWPPALPEQNAGRPTPWQPPPPLTPDKVRVPNENVDVHIAAFNQSMATNKTVLFIFVAFVLLSSLLAIFNLPR